MTPILFFIAFLLIFIHYYLNIIRVPKNFPPGPSSWPIWGGYYQMLWENFRLPYKTFHNFAKKYGTNVVGTYLGPFVAVVACDTDTCRDVLLRPEFQARIDAFVPRFRGDGERLGIIFSEGDLWQEQRRFMLRNMRDFGFGRRSDMLESKLQDEIYDLIQMMKAGEQSFCKGGFAYIPELFYGLNGNMAIQIFAGDRKPFSEAFEFTSKMVKQNQKIEATTGALNITPWMRYFAPGPVGYNVTKEVTAYAKDFIQKLINDHKHNLTDDTTNDFIDRYVQEMRRRIGTEEGVSTFSENQLRVIGMDMLFAGSVTISLMSGFIMLLLTKHTDVRKKCQEEIDEVVGRDRLPTLTDRQNLPYMEATIREAMRIQTLVPLGVPHRAVEDTTLGGYFVPQDAVVFTSLYSAHLDEKVWNKPEEFNPSRFIGEDGKLVKRDHSIPFGLGKRVCAGETFARQNIFVIIASMVQNFDFTQCDDKPLPDFNENITGISEGPKPFWVKVEPRF